MLGPRVGPLVLENPFALAPMAGIGDPPYRRLCRRGGAAMVCAEMVSANALHFRDDRSNRMLTTFPDEHPISLQVFGQEPDRLAGAASHAEAAGADVVDLNCGCPVPKITKSGGGISLMKDEVLFSRCVRAMVKAVSVPVTVKMRLGFVRGENRAVRFASIAEAEGASAVAVHARSREDHHSGPPALEELGRVVEAVRVPVFGNGGVGSYAEAKRMMDVAGVAGVMVGQAAIGNPFLFLELKAGLEGRVFVATAEQRFSLLREHARMNVDYYGEEMGIRRLRKFIPSYVKGWHGAAAFRAAGVRAVTLRDIDVLIDSLLEQVPPSLSPSSFPSGFGMNGPSAIPSP